MWCSRSTQKRLVSQLPQLDGTIETEIKGHSGKLLLQSCYYRRIDVRLSDVPVIVVKRSLIRPEKNVVAIVISKAHPRIIHAVVSSVRHPPSLAHQEVIFQRAMDGNQVCSGITLVQTDFPCASSKSLVESFVDRAGEEVASITCKRKLTVNSLKSVIFSC
jgi:hypothetical protein